MTIAVRRVALSLLHADPGNIRAELHGIDTLAASIRSQGLLQPLLVANQSGRFVVVDGHRRLAALRAVGRGDALCVITPAVDRCTALARMISAAHSQALEPVEQARAFKEMREQGMSTADIGKATGVGPGTVRDRLALLELPDPVQQMVTSKELPVREAAAMARSLRSTGAAQTSNRRTGWLNAAHPLAAAVRACPHIAAERSAVGGVGCGQCWEDAIRADERAAMSRQRAS